MDKLTYQDIDLLLMMGANGFGLDVVHYVNDQMYVEISRFEDKVKATIKQTEKGLEISECKSCSK